MIIRTWLLKEEGEPVEKFATDIEGATLRLASFLSCDPDVLVQVEEDGLTKVKGARDTHIEAVSIVEAE